MLDLLALERLLSGCPTATVHANRLEQVGSDVPQVGLLFVWSVIQLCISDALYTALYCRPQ